MNPVLARRGVAATGLIGLLGMTVYVMMQPFNSLDRLIQGIVSHMQNGLMTALMKVITLVGNPGGVLLLMAILAVVYWRQHKRFESIWVLTTVIGGDVIAEVIKTITARARPTHQLVPDTGFSFPSIHTLSAVMLVFLLLSLLKKGAQGVIAARSLAVIWIFLVALSRVYLRDHFPTDTIAGVFLGLFWWGTMAYAFHQTMLRVQANAFLVKILPNQAND